MTAEYTVALAGLAVSVTLYLIAFRQIKRAFPDRAERFIGESIALAVGGAGVAALRGEGPVWWTTAPAVMAAVCFIAGKGSVAVLIHEDGDETPMSEATAQARKRFGYICVTALVAALLVVLVMP